MKSKVTFYIIQWRVACTDFDDRPDHRFEPQLVTVEYTHIFINKKRRMKKAMLDSLKPLKGWPMAYVATFNKDYVHPYRYDDIMLDPSI